MNQEKELFSKMLSGLKAERSRQPKRVCPFNRRGRSTLAKI